MSKMTLLAMTQSILSSMDSDDVNAIDDTEESIQVADEIQYAYEELMSQKEWHHLRDICKLNSLGDTSKPTTVGVPENIAEITNLQYETTDVDDADTSFSNITYQEPDTFLSNQQSLKSSDSTVESSSQNGVVVLIRNDKFPDSWTTFDDETIMFDSYKNDVDSTSQGDKCIVKCVTHSVWSKEDSFVPDLPEKMFPLLLADAKRACHLYFKQQDSIVDAKRALRGNNKMRQDDARLHSTVNRPRFGRC